MRSADSLSANPPAAWRAARGRRATLVLLARGLARAALALAAPALALAFVGCGGVATSPAAESVGSQLTIYSGLPLQGPSGAISKQIVGGEELALANAGGRVGRFTINFASLDDSNTTTGDWDPDVTSANAKAVAQDPTTIAYIGDYNSGATAVSLPLINGAGIPQVSPASPYVGLTSSLDAGQDEPERFYPTGKRTFARIAPGDPAQASAQVDALRALGVRRVYLLADQDPFDAPLAQIVAGDASAAGIKAFGPELLTIAPGANFAGEVAKIARSGAEAVFLSATATSQAAQLFAELHSAMPRLRLLGSATMLSPVFTGALGGAEAVTTVGSPVLPASMYPASAHAVFGRYRRQFGEPAEPWALYGYESMSVLLGAIRAAGARGDERAAVTANLLATHDRRSVLGVYSVDASGEASLSNYAIDRIERGVPRFWRAFSDG